jgi:hypothetical protein
MNAQDWLAKVETNKDALRNLISGYHPANLFPRSPQSKMDATITAPNAERACEIVREQIRKESFERPDIQFDIALAKQDHETISSLLSAAWFGVPESTSCWGIEGFNVAVDLLDDPVEPDYPENPYV